MPTWTGFLYLAVVLDVWSRRVVGWSMANHMRQELVLAALDMAAVRRQPTAVIHHSDHGSQYTSLAFGKRCETFGIRVSIGTVGDCYDNAMAESFFASLECELIDRTTYRSHADARLAVFDFIEGWYNLELTRVGGHRTLWVEGVHDAENTRAVPAGIPAAAGGTGPSRESA